MEPELAEDGAVAAAEIGLAFKKLIREMDDRAILAVRQLEDETLDALRGFTKELRSVHAATDILGPALSTLAEAHATYKLALKPMIGWAIEYARRREAGIMIDPGRLPEYGSADA
jgi:hypothetical protein